MKPEDTMKLKGIAIVTIGMFMIIGCSQGKYSDVEKVMDKQIKAQESLIKSLEKASSAEEAGKALTDFASDMEKLQPEMDKIEKKYPDLTAPQAMPEELQSKMKEQIENSQKISQLMAKTMKEYANEPVFQKATKKMQEIMQNM